LCKKPSDTLRKLYETKNVTWIGFIRISISIKFGQIDKRHELIYEQLIINSYV